MKNKGIVLLLIFAIGIASVLFLSRSGEQTTKKAMAGVEAPDFTLQDTEGKTWKLSELRGKVVLVNFWASWCDSCKEENPSIQSLLNAEKGNDKLVFVSILYNDEPAKALAYMKASNLSFPVLVDTMNLWKTYGLTGVPETFIIDKKGILQQKVVGPMQWDSPDVRAALEKLVSAT
ncbi:MAG: TlpA family protein disulfide reductase [Alphaproteobacteria bacterium]|uniref:TlpA family protein disulfide reductase n=1 Tax=Candidatus Nitrobium versatile TaxID=2884831 RepID=A0A953M3A6_9BACT|nr:TlpA family protein disulfide reductase [Candidatus Nitrobium versatile]